MRSIWRGTQQRAYRYRVRMGVVVVVSATVACGADSPTTTAPSDAELFQVVVCPVRPLPSLSRFCWDPASDQVAACAGRPRPVLDVVASRELGGARVTYSVANAVRVASVAYLNTDWGGGCGGPVGSGFFSPGVTFPVQVRVVAWDEHGCLAGPVCMTVY